MAGQVWVTNTEGGYMYSDQLSDKLRMELLPSVKFRQYCDAKDAMDKGLHTGAEYHWDVYSKVSTRGGTLTETNTMQEAGFTITQGTLTVTEYGNSVPYTGKLDNLSKHPVEEIIEKVLAVDAREVLDGAAFDQFNDTVLRVVPTAGTSTTAVTLTTNGTATLTNNVALGKGHVKAIVDTMKERNIPAFSDDHYMAIARPSTYRTLKDDIEAVYQYVDQGFKLIYNGEIGKYEGVRLTEQTNVAAGGAADSTTYNWYTADAWNNAASDWAFFFGADTVAEAIVIPEEIRGKIPGDFGRSKGVAWYYLGGFGLVHTAATNARIIKWDSAA